MEIISKEEFDKLPKKSGAFSSLRGFIDQLEVGQALVVSKNEWKAKSKLGNTVGQTYRKLRSEKEFKVRTLADDKGWGVLRIK